ncbi:MAG: biotin transporter BioY [Clostridia bacterium]|nr:biotin transporter BioY [Clostridia bacterium]
MNTETARPSFVRRMTTIAIMAALICVCSWLTVPSVVPFTMQTFAVFCAVLLLGGKDGLYAVLLYLIMGAIGLPVFSGFSGGVGYMLGPTGGYMVGFVLTALLYWLCEPLCKKRRFLRYPVLAAGLLLCYAAGTLWFVTVMSAPERGGDYTYLSALGVCVVPYLLPDAAKLLLAGFLCDRVGKRLRLDG